MQEIIFLNYSCLLLLKVLFSRGRMRIQASMLLNLTDYIALRYLGDRWLLAGQKSLVEPLKDILSQLRTRKKQICKPWLRRLTFAES